VSRGGTFTEKPRAEVKLRLRGEIREGAPLLHETHARAERAPDDRAPHSKKRGIGTINSLCEDWVRERIRWRRRVDYEVRSRPEKKNRGEMFTSRVRSIFS